MTTLLLILFNPFNLVGLYFALSGLAVWGLGESYKLDFSLFSLFKVFGVPTVIFATVWVLIKVWKRMTNWRLYIASTLLSFLIIVVGSQLYWSLIER